MVSNGIGMQKDRMFITFYKDYAAYIEAMRTKHGIPHADIDGVESFLLDLEDETSYWILSMQPLSRRILSKKGVEQ
jgi:hypothetical protein